MIINKSHQETYNGTKKITSDILTIIQDKNKETEFAEILQSFCQKFEIEILDGPAWFLCGHYD